MGIAYGVTTNFQATKGIVQDGLIFNIDPAVKDSYTGSGFNDLKKRQSGLKTVMNNGAYYDTKDGGGCFVFDGVDDNVDISPFYTLTGLEQTSSNTISFWYKIITHQYYNGIIGNGGSSQRNPWIWSNINGRITSDQPIGGTMRYLSSSSSSLSSGVWRHIAYVIDGDNSIFRLYINGSLDNTLATDGGNTGNAYGNVGIGDNNGANYSNSKVSCVHLYNRALTAAEVSRNFNVMRHRFGI